MIISRAKKAWVILLWACFLGSAQAVPNGFNIQGRLTDANGVNREGNFTLKFTIYDLAVGGTPLWSRTYSGLTVRNGNFQTRLDDGDGQPALSGIFAAGDSRHLEIKVMHGTGVPNEEPALVPRQTLVSVPYSFQSASAGGIIATGAAVITAGGAEGMRVLPNGNVGIGTASPGALLDVFNGALRVGDGTRSFQTYASASQNVIYAGASSNHGLALTANNAEGMRITAAGKVGIGATDPSAQLQLTNVMQIQGPAAPSYPTGGAGLELAYDADLNTTGTGIIQAYDRTGSSSRPLILNNNGGNVGIGTTAPGQKLSVAGTVESTSGGFKFPDGTMQATAAGSISGHVVQIVRNEFSSPLTTAATIPVDDTIPQSNEGVEILTVTITPKAAANRLMVEFQGNCFSDTYGADPVAAIFRDSDVNAIAAGEFYLAPHPYSFGKYLPSLNVEVVAGTTAPITFRVRFGINGGSATFNGNSSGQRRFGGVQRNVITVMEIAN